MALAVRTPDGQYRSMPGSRPRWAILVVWVVVNGVALLQAAGFVTRVIDPGINRILGWFIVALALPASAAGLALFRSGAGWRHLVGPLAFDLFVAYAVVVDYTLEIEFRDPRQPVVLVPYLVLFFGSIVLMGAPMFRIDRRRWMVTAFSTVVLLGAMLFAMSRGVG
jgi:hypothetical protein